MHWISVETELPLLDQLVLLYMDYSNRIEIGYLEDLNQEKRLRARVKKERYTPQLQWLIVWTYLDCEPSHWMHLPDKPEIKQ